MSAKLFSMVLALMVIAATVQAQQFVTDGLVAFWTLDSADISGDTVKDISGNGNDATIMGTLNSVAGKIDEALEFDRGPNYVEIPPMGQWEQASVECWAYTSDLSLQYQGIVSTWAWTTGKVHFKFQDNQIQVDKNGAGKIVFDAVVETWYHIIYTTDTIGDALKLYVDGELVAEGPGGAGTPENMDERRIGSEHDDTRYLLGMIDEVRFYDRVLDQNEVARNFNVTSNVVTAVDSTGKLATTWSHIKRTAGTY